MVSISEQLQQLQQQKQQVQSFNPQLQPTASQLLLTQNPLQRGVQQQLQQIQRTQAKTQAGQELSDYEKQFTSYLKSPEGIRAYAQELGTVSSSTRIEERGFGTISDGKVERKITKIPITTTTWTSPYGQISSTNADTSKFERSKYDLSKAAYEKAFLKYNEDISQLEKQGFKPIYDQGQLSGFDTGKMSIPIQNFNAYIEKLNKESTTVPGIIKQASVPSANLTSVNATAPTKIEKVMNTVSQPWTNEQARYQQGLATGTGLRWDVERWFNKQRGTGELPYNIYPKSFNTQGEVSTWTEPSIMFFNRYLGAELGKRIPDKYSKPVEEALNKIKVSEVLFPQTKYLVPEKYKGASVAQAITVLEPFATSAMQFSLFAPGTLLQTSRTGTNIFEPSFRTNVQGTRENYPGEFLAKPKAPKASALEIVKVSENPAVFKFIEKVKIPARMEYRNVPTLEWFGYAPTRSVYMPEQTFFRQSEPIKVSPSGVIQPPAYVDTIRTKPANPWTSRAGITGQSRIENLPYSFYDAAAKKQFETLFARLKQSNKGIGINAGLKPNQNFFAGTVESQNLFLYKIKTKASPLFQEPKINFLSEELYLKYPSLREQMKDVRGFSVLKPEKPIRNAEGKLVKSPFKVGEIWIVRENILKPKADGTYLPGIKGVILHEKGHYYSDKLGLPGSLTWKQTNELLPKAEALLENKYNGYNPYPPSYWLKEYFAEKYTGRIPLKKTTNIDIKFFKPGKTISRADIMGVQEKTSTGEKIDIYDYFFLGRDTTMPTARPRRFSETSGTSFVIKEPSKSDEFFLSTYRSAETITQTKPVLINEAKEGLAFDLTRLRAIESIPRVKPAVNLITGKAILTSNIGEIIGMTAARAIQTPRELQIATERNEFITVTVPRTLQIPRTQIIPRSENVEILRTEVIPRTFVIPKVLNIARTTVTPRIIPRRGMRTVIVTGFPRVPEKRKPTSEAFFFANEKEKKRLLKRKKNLKLFTIQVRRKKKFKTIGAESDLLAASRKGFASVKRSLAASYRVLFGGKPVRSPIVSPELRTAKNNPLILVQKSRKTGSSGSRLGTREEVLAIQSSRKKINFFRSKK